MSTEWSELSEAESQAETVRVVAEEALNPVAARYAAMDLLARREHLQRELETKLLKRFSELPDAREVIAEVVVVSLKMST